MAKKESKNEKIEREYVIPLRSRYQRVARYKKTPKAIRTVKEFLVKHMKIYDRDLNKIKLDNYLNEFLWARGIKNPPHKVKVKAVKEEDIVKVELIDYPTKLKFKKARADKSAKAAEEIAKKKKAETNPREDLEKKVDEESKEEEKEKKAAVVEEGKAMEKAAAKQHKHETKSQAKQPKRPVRQAMAK
jgi:large subunit ribosomal protein L31e